MGAEPDQPGQSGAPGYSELLDAVLAEYGRPPLADNPDFVPDESWWYYEGFSMLSVDGAPPLGFRTDPYLEISFGPFPEFLDFGPEHAAFARRDLRRLFRSAATISYGGLLGRTLVIRLWDGDESWFRWSTGVRKDRVGQVFERDYYRAPASFW